ncbi:Uncharacterised protein [Salmonella enterica subsp. arizonae]|uniref:Uncharacterized protein n=1 Tax=Salmonella enterica subsp. arizonae TaxID=59203 RepID=A0A379SCA4_SALER|nr:Uncharacterised protein [Salmonella enterica subsp. arizonae]
MRMFRKNILWIAIGNRDSLLLISKKNLFSEELTDLPPQHLKLDTCRMALRLSGIKEYNYQQIGPRKR